MSREKRGRQQQRWRPVLSTQLLACEKSRKVLVLIQVESGGGSQQGERGRGQSMFVSTFETTIMSSPHVAVRAHAPRRLSAVLPICAKPDEDVRGQCGGGWNLGTVAA